MAERDATPEQLAAIRVVGSAAVRAGAGAGKTRVLSEHFLHLLRPGDDGVPVVREVGEILAITFTEKAAAEMKTKIRALLAEEAASAPAAERPRWERARRELPGAQISTIHAFCHRIVRENPLEADVDSAAVLLDEHEGRLWLETAVQEALTARLRAGDPGARLLVARHGLQRARDGGAVGHCIRVLERLGTSGRTPAWLVEATQAQAARAPAAETALRAACDDLAARIDVAVREGGGKGVDRLREEWPRWAPVLRALSGATPCADVLALKELVPLLRRIVPGAGDALKVDRDRLRGAIVAQWGALAALGPSADVARCIAAVAEAVRARRAAEGVLTFDDLVVAAHAVITGHPAVRERYARRFRAILVDEFQDTDAVQADLVRALAGDTVPLFVVGDEKQSIYGFRGADVAVFHQMRERLGRELSLGTNFRSQPAILEFVNALAAATLRRPADCADPAYWTVYDESQRLVPHRPQTWPRPGVRLVSFVAEQLRRGKVSAAAMREFEARALAGVVRGLHERDGVPWGGITVLFRVLTEVKVYEHALRRARVPYYVVKGRGFFQCQEIRDLLNLLAAIADPDDATALAAVLRSPFFAIDDDTLARLAWPDGHERPALARRIRRGETFADLPEQAAALGAARDLLVRLRRLASRATIAELLEEALAATDFEAVCLTQFQGTQKVANVRKLIELARDAERRRRFDLRRFVAWGRDLEAREPREPEATLVGEQDDVVRLMTIHQAKGLEFDVVVLPDLARPLRKDGEPVVLDDELGVLVQADDGGVHRFPHAWLEEHGARRHDRARAEHARLLYVACTRAKDHLVLLEGKGDVGRLTKADAGPPKDWAGAVWDLLGRERVLAAARAAEPQAVLPVPGGGEVLVERAELWLDAEAGPLPEAPEPVEAEPTAAERDAAARVLDFRPPAPPEVVTTPTALADFRRCPRQYWYRHVLGLPERGEGGSRTTLLGTAAHAVLERLDFDVGEADVERRLAATPETLLLRPREVERLAADLRRAARFLAAERAAGLEIVGREVPFVLALPREAPRLLLQGRLDVLARRGARHVVRDFKYAVPGDDAVERYGPQLGTYRLAVAAAGADAVDAELVFLRGEPAVRAVPAIDTRAETEALVAAGAALGEALASDDPAAFPKAPPGPAECERLGCGHRRRCWGAAAVTRRDAGRPTGIAAS